MLLSQSYVIEQLNFFKEQTENVQNFLVIFSHVDKIFSMLPFLFYRLHWETGGVSKMIHSCFHKKSTIRQVNVQAATTENEEQYI